LVTQYVDRSASIGEQNVASGFTAPITPWKRRSKFLTRLRKVTEEQLDQFAAGKELPPNIAKVRPETDALNAHETRRSRRGFCILDYVTETRVVGRNYAARCPSCALAGRDRGRDNLAILVPNPRFYQCWAGCSKENIRAALGCPIPVRQTI
jgi:hypothetical protein